MIDPQQQHARQMMEAVLRMTNGSKQHTGFQCRERLPDRIVRSFRRVLALGRAASVANPYGPKKQNKKSRQWASHIMTPRSLAITTSVQAIASSTQKEQRDKKFSCHPSSEMHHENKKKLLTASAYAVHAQICTQYYCGSTEWLQFFLFRKGYACSFTAKTSAPHKK